MKNSAEPTFAFVQAVSSSPVHSMSKPNRESIVLVKGLGVDGDAHSGETVKHRSRVARDPSQPNLRQVHLIHSELHDELRTQGFDIKPGEMGENITTTGIDLLGLATGTILTIGSTQIRIMGLRNPCVQLDGLQSGLMQAVLDKDAEGNLIRKGGVMGVVINGGEIRPGDEIQLTYPELPHTTLQPV